MHRKSSEKAKQKTQTSLIENLPEEILTEIISHVPHKDRILKVNLTCRLFHRIAQDDQFNKELKQLKAKKKKCGQFIQDMQDMQDMQDCDSNIIFLRGNESIIKNITELPIIQMNVTPYLNTLQQSGMRSMYTRDNTQLFLFETSKNEPLLDPLLIIFCLDDAADIKKQLDDLNTLVADYPDSMVFVVTKQAKIDCDYFVTTINEDDSVDTFYQRMFDMVHALYEQTLIKLTGSGSNPKPKEPEGPQPSNCTIS